MQNQKLPLEKDEVMLFQDFPPGAPYLRLFYPDNKVISQMVFSSHGIWDPAKYGMTRLRYTYYWYTQPSVVLKGEEYARKVLEMGSASPVDIFGPGSGEVANMALFPLEQSIFAFTVKRFREAYATTNPKGMGLMAFHGNKDVPGMKLSTLDSQLLPHFKYPVETPVHMVVCRSLNMNHVTTTVSNEVKVIAPSDGELKPVPSPATMNPFDSITEDML
jgi:hypothetical protein